MNPDLEPRAACRHWAHPGRRPSPHPLGTAFVLLACVITPAGAQTDEPQWEALIAAVRKPYFRVGMLIQTVADLQIERRAPGTNGFSLANARFNVGGELDRFGYFLQANFAGTPAVLDAWMSYHLTPAVTLSAGQMKAPFSAEFLTSAARLDVVNRSQVVRALAPNRQLGAQVSVGQADALMISGGIFNGNTFATNRNDNNHLLYAGRLSRTVRSSREPSWRLVVGGNVAYSRDANASLPGVDPTFAGDRTLLGADARFTRGALLLAGELIYARLEAPTGAVTEPLGWHATGGISISERSQVVFRWDRLDPGPAPASDRLIVGANLWPSQAAEIQVNYLIDTDQPGLDRHQLLINFQIGF